MSFRKPGGVQFTSWVDAQIADARRRGDFDNLPGQGKPLDLSDRGDDWWINQKLRDEGLALALPEGLALRKELPGLLEEIRQLRTEERVRTALAKLNSRIRKANSGPGPHANAAQVEMEEFVRAWRKRVFTKPG